MPDELTTEQWLQELRDDLKDYVRKSLERGKNATLRPAIRLALEAANYAIAGAIEEAYSRLVVHLKQELPMTPYPSALDIPAYLADAMAFLRGQGDKNAVIHDSWEALGYGAGKFFPITAVAPTATPQVALSIANRSDAEIADMIESHITSSQGVSAFDWSAFLNFALQIAQKIIAQFFSGLAPAPAA